VALLPIGAYTAVVRRSTDPEDALQVLVDSTPGTWCRSWGTCVSYEPIEEPIAWLAELASARGLTDRVAMLHRRVAAIPARACAHRTRGIEGMPSHPLRGAAAIAGLGITPQGKVFDTNAIGFA